MSETRRAPAQTSARRRRTKTKKRTGVRLVLHKLWLLCVALVYAIARTVQRVGKGKSLQATVLALLCIVLFVIVVKTTRANHPAAQAQTQPQAQTADNSAAAPADSKQAAAPKAQPVVELKVEATEDTKPSKLILEQTVIAGGTTQTSYSFEKPIRFGDSTKYASLPGIMAFRGNNYRNSASYGTANLKDKKLSIEWQHSSGALTSPGGETWTGSGWTGQPLIVTWPKETRKVMNMESWAQEQDELTEVIYATMDGHVYFYELETGKATREPLNLGFTFKGAGSLDPRGYPILYVGAGISGARGAGRAFVVSLVDGKVLYEFGAADGYSHRQGWTMFDASPLVSAETDTLIYPGESGIVYFIKLNTHYDEAAGTLTVDPDEPVRWRYQGTRTGDKYWIGIEASPVVWNHYLYMADNGGNLMCMDLDTLQLVWVHDTLDDTNCTPVLECDEDGHPYLYISTSFHAGWRASANSSVAIPIWKIDGLNGSVVWRKDYQCWTVPDISGGVQGTLACGKNDLSDMIFVPVSRTGDSANSGLLAALDKNTGEVIWEFETSVYSWSSPVDFYDSSGHGYILYSTTGGYMYLLDGKTGEKLDAIDLNGNIEASAAVFNDMVVVGHRAQQIFGIRLS